MLMTDFVWRYALILALFIVFIFLVVKSYGDGGIWRPYSITEKPVDTSKQQGIVVPDNAIRNIFKTQSANIRPEISSNKQINKIDRNININLLNKDKEIKSLLTKNIKLRDYAKLDILKRDRQISNLTIINNELKSKLIALNKKASKLSAQIRKISSSAIRKEYNSQDKDTMQKQINNLNSIMKRVRINANNRCHRFKKFIDDNNIKYQIDCKLL